MMASKLIHFFMISLSALHLLAAPVHVVPRDFTIPQDPTLAFQRTDTITFIVDAANNVTESVPVELLKDFQLPPKTVYEVQPRKLLGTLPEQRSSGGPGAANLPIGCWSKSQGVRQDNLANIMNSACYDLTKHKLPGGISRSVYRPLNGRGIAWSIHSFLPVSQHSKLNQKACLEEMQNIAYFCQDPDLWESGDGWSLWIDGKVSLIHSFKITI